MYQIVICDDDPVFISYIKRLLTATCSLADRECLVREYASGEQLVWDLEGPGQIDLLILDIQLKGMDGYAVAEKFRRKFPDAVLVFCSGVFGPTTSSFYSAPFRYILKSDSEQEILHTLSEALGEADRLHRREFLIGHYHGSTFHIEYYDILYIENEKRGGKIKVREASKKAYDAEKILVSRKLPVLEEELAPHGFAMPNKSFLVNLYHVDVVRKNEIELDNGEVIGISRLFKSHFSEMYAKFPGGKYDNIRLPKS
ncbi:MAG: LytTR family DNA-binding domain-containing protein [Lachnospiraceae bacterium]|nr:LytTR family DNA-binding domain-containing protein [Lachnospiraceae bacterium]